MKYSLKLGKPFGIKISIHWTFLLLIAWIVIIDVRQGLDMQQILLSIIFILTLFLCVTLHELGHALTAKRYGSEVHSITLLPIGGMANIKDMPEKPGQELVVSAAGLIVNVVIAGIIWMFLAIGGRPDLQQMNFQAITAENFFIMLMFVNLFVVVFNLIPAFPMDGGRLLRAALSFKMDRLKATKHAKNAGQVFAVAFIIAGMFINPFLVIIGFFVFLGARAEYEMIKFRQGLNDFKVNDALITDYTTLDRTDSLGKAADLLVHKNESGFIVVSNGDFEGMLTKEGIIDGLSKYGKEGKVEDSMNTALPSLDINRPLHEVFQEMQQNKYSVLPVLSKDKIKGILDRESINELMLVQNAMH
jgi:Zn-dependent protease/CBS domain-containing protein